MVILTLGLVDETTSCTAVVSNGVVEDSMADT